MIDYEMLKKDFEEIFDERDIEVSEKKTIDGNIVFYIGEPVGSLSLEGNKFVARMTCPESVKSYYYDKGCDIVESFNEEDIDDSILQESLEYDWDFIEGNVEIEDGDVFYDGDCVGFVHKFQAIFNAYKDCPEEVKEYFLNSDWAVKSLNY